MSVITQYIFRWCTIAVLRRRRAAWEFWLIRSEHILENHHDALIHLHLVIVCTQTKSSVIKNGPFKGVWESVSLCTTLAYFSFVVLAKVKEDLVSCAWEPKLWQCNPCFCALKMCYHVHIYNYYYAQ